MNIFSTLFRREAVAPSEEAEKPQDTAQARVRKNIIGINSEMAAYTVAEFARAIQLRAQTFARAQFEFQLKSKDNWKKSNWGKRQHLNWLLHVKPNDYQNAQEMWEMASRISDLSWNGMCCLWCPGIDDDDIQMIIPCTGVWNYTDNTYQISNEKLHVASMIVPACEVLVLKNGFDCSMITMLRRTLETSATADEFTKDTLGKGGTFKAIVKQETSSIAYDSLDSLDDEEVKKNFDDINQQFKDGNDFIYDPSAAQINQISQSFQDLQLPQTKDSCLGAVARVSGVPLPLLFQSTNAVYKSVDDAFHLFIGLSIEPRWTSITQELNGKALTYSEYGKVRYWPNTRHLCLDSDKSKAQTQAVLVNSGIITPNEARHELNLEAREDGNVLHEPKKTTTSTTKEGGEE